MLDILWCVPLALGVSTDAYFGEILRVQAQACGANHSLVNQTAPTSVLDVLHHQHEEGGSGHSGTVFVTHVGIWI